MLFNLLEINTVVELNKAIGDFEDAYKMCEKFNDLLTRLLNFWVKNLNYHGVGQVHYMRRGFYIYQAKIKQSSYDPNKDMICWDGTYYNDPSSFSDDSYEYKMNIYNENNLHDMNMFPTRYINDKKEEVINKNDMVTIYKLSALKHYKWDKVKERSICCVM